jgi:hypothetical protein
LEQHVEEPICFHAGFLLGLFFNPEDGGDMFLQSVSWLLTDYMALYPRRMNLSNVKESLDYTTFLFSYVKLCSILCKLAIEACSDFLMRFCVSLLWRYETFYYADENETEGEV